MNTKVNQQISNDEMINNCVLDREREWFQYEYQQFEFHKDMDLKDWWIVESFMKDKTGKLSKYENINLVEFVHFSEETFFEEDKDELHFTDYDDWDVEIGVEKIWNSLPFKNYESPYEVIVRQKPISLKPFRDYELKRYESHIKNPFKVINHSTKQSLGLMTSEISEWKMESLWKGNEPQFYKDKQGV